MFMFFFILTFLFFFFHSPAQAYLDPGSSSYILHLIIAAMAGFCVTIKLYWLKLKNFFFKISRPNKQKK